LRSIQTEGKLNLFFIKKCNFVILSTISLDDFLFSQKIQSAQLIPILVSDLEGDYYGLPGLFMAGVFSAALR